MERTPESEDNVNGGDEDLDRLAVEEIMKETKRGRERAETMGPLGWVKCPLQPTNKRFFQNILIGTVSDSKRNTRKRRHVEDSPKYPLVPAKSGECSTSDVCNSKDRQLEEDRNEDQKRKDKKRAEIHHDKRDYTHNKFSTKHKKHHKSRHKKRS